MIAPPETARAIVFVLFGPLVWGAHITLAYAGHASLCAAGDRLPLFGAGDLPWLFAGATVLALAALAWGAVRPQQVGAVLALRDGDVPFLTTLMRLLVVLSLLGVAYSTLAIVLVPNCLQLR